MNTPNVAFIKSTTALPFFMSTRTLTSLATGSGKLPFPHCTFVEVVEVDCVEFVARVAVDSTVVGGGWPPAAFVVAVAKRDDACDAFDVVAVLDLALVVVAELDCTFAFAAAVVELDFNASLLPTFRDGCAFAFIGGVFT